MSDFSGCSVCTVGWAPIYGLNTRVRGREIQDGEEVFRSNEKPLTRENGEGPPNLVCLMLLVLAMPGSGRRMY